MGIGQQLQRLNLFSKWNPNCPDSFSPHDANSILCNWHLTYSLVIDRPILALMVVNHRKPKSSEEKVQTHPPASSFCNIVSWILNLFFPSSENSQNVLPFFFYAFGEMISFLASTYVFCQTETAPNGVLWKVWMWNNMSAAQLVPRINIEHRTEMQTFH